MRCMSVVMEDYVWPGGQAQEVFTHPAYSEERGKLWALKDGKACPIYTLDRLD